MAARSGEYAVGAPTEPAPPLDEEPISQRDTERMLPIPTAPVRLELVTNVLDEEDIPP